MNTLPTELIESLQSCDVILFLGAGLSVAAGLPGWADLLRPLAQSVGARWPSNKTDLTAEHLLRAAQYYENQRGRNALVKHLRTKLGDKGASPTAVHQLAISLPVKTMFTTNYDDLIERTLREEGHLPHTIVEDFELAFWSEGYVQVVKLCGDLTQPKSIIITQSDFNTYFATHPRLAEWLRTTLESKTALFLGYSLRDPFFNQIWDNIGLDFGEMRRWGYAVMFDTDPLDIDDFQRRGIRVIDLESSRGDKSEALEEWLVALIDALSPASVTGLGSGTSDGITFPDPESAYGTGNRWAILVGVNGYEDEINYGHLQVCVKDVDALCHTLVAGGFDPSRIRVLTDDTSELPTRENVLVALSAIANATEPDDLLLFYYSGHGDEDDSESYLVARNGRRLVLCDTAIPLSRVRQVVEQAPARAKVIILDACHSGADIGGKGPKPMSAEFLKHVFEQAEGMAILASCKQGQLSYEWRVRERSVFTHHLVEALAGQADRDEKGFVTVQDVNRHVVDGVKLWASQRNVSQTPTLQYTVAGDIVLCSYELKE